MGKFFAFDGIDRSGKSTAVNNIAAQLEKRGAPVELLSSGSIADIRVVDYFGIYPDEIVYMLLWQAHRLLDLTKIQPALKVGSIVLCYRYMLSNLAHNWWTNLDSGFQRRMQSIYLERCNPPDIYFVFTIPYRTFCERDDGDTPMTEEQFRDISAQYRLWADLLATAKICEVVIIDGTMSKEDICKLVMHHIDKILAEEAD